MRNYVILTLGLFLAFASCDKTGKIQVTEAGNQYILHKSGKGEVAAETDAYVYVHAILTANDSILFDTRKGGGEATAVQIPAPGSISPGGAGPVEDVLRGRRAGDSLTLIVRIDTLEIKPPGLEDVDNMYYTLAIQEVVDAETYAARMAIKQQEMQAATERVIEREAEMLRFAEEVHASYLLNKIADLQTTESGLLYVIHEEGTGPQAEVGDIATVQYIGMLTSDGTVFDQSFQRGQGIQFPIGEGRVIMGWDEGLLLLKEGTRATFFIPSALGYGEMGTPDGTIPENSELMFYVELEKLN